MLRAKDTTECDEAWATFLAAHSDVVLHTCRAVARDVDRAMDAYTYVIAALRQDECRRLRAYAPDGKTKFTTWLVVVSRRLVLDHVRQQYGRPRSDDAARRDEHNVRRRLEDLLAEQIEPDQLPSESARSPDDDIRRTELRSALRRAVDALAPDDRLLLVLRFSDERPIREIKRLAGLPSVFHVYRRVSALLGRLRIDLERRGIEGSEP